MKLTNLKNYVEERKQLYLEKYGKLDWHWFDEGLAWAIGDYLSSCELTRADEMFLRDNGLISVLDFIEED